MGTLPQEYVAGTNRLLSVQFTDEAGVPFDPDDVELRIHPPGNAAIQVYQGPTNLDVGLYTQLVEIPFVEASVGTWSVRWSGVGVAQEWYFWVKRSLFMGAEGVIVPVYTAELPIEIVEVGSSLQFRIRLATTSTPGAMSAADKTKLDAVSALSFPETITTNHPVTTWNQVLKVDPTAGPVEIRLSTAVGKPSQIVAIKNIAEAGVDGADNPITVLPLGGETIDGQEAIDIVGVGSGQVLLSDGSTTIQAWPGVEAPPEPLFHEIFAGVVHAWDAKDITFSGFDLATWPAVVAGATLLPIGSGCGYLADDGGYPSATFTGGGRLEGACSLTQPIMGYLVRYRATAVHGQMGCVVAWVTAAGANGQFVASHVYADDVANARFTQASFSVNDTSAGGNLGVGTAWQTLSAGLNGSDLIATIAGVTYSAARPTGTASLNKINVGLLNVSGATLIRPFSGAVSHIVALDHVPTSQDLAAAAAWTPPLP